MYTQLHIHTWGQYLIIREISILWSVCHLSTCTSQELHHPKPKEMVLTVVWFMYCSTACARITPTLITGGTLDTKAVWCLGSGVEENRNCSKIERSTSSPPGSRTPKISKFALLKLWKADNHFKILSLQIWDSYKCFESRKTEEYAECHWILDLISTEARCEKLWTNNERKTKSDGIPTPGKWKKIQRTAAPPQLEGEI